MNQHLTDSRLANLGANAIHQAFKSYRTQFDAVTDRAKKRFENRDWHGMQADVARRLTLYREVVDQVVLDVRQLLEERVNDKLVWASMKAVYSGLIGNHDAWELAETFFNSVTRIFATVGVDPQIEFVNTDLVDAQEFQKFLGLPDELRAVFEEHHADLYGVDFWRQCQARLQAGKIIHIFPYTESDRLHDEEVGDVSGTFAQQ
jgi:isocitrate dehydrogenase kinase/phosphatase